MGLGLSEPIFHRRSDNKPDLFFSDRIKVNPVKERWMNTVPWMLSLLLIAATLTVSVTQAFEATLEQVADELEKLAQPGDMIITVGAGDIYRAGEMLLKRGDAQ